MPTRACRPAVSPCRPTSMPAMRKISRFSAGAETDGRIALYLLDQRDLPGEIVPRVLLVVGCVVVGLVPDVVPRSRGTLDAALGGSARSNPRRVCALQHAPVRIRPQRRGFRRREVREQPILRSKNEALHLADHSPCFRETR